MKIILFILIPIFGNCFTFLSAKWDCNSESIIIKYLGSDSLVYIDGAGGKHGDYKTFTTFWQSSGVFKPDVILANGVVHIRVFNNTELVASITIIKNCLSNIIPLKISDIVTKPNGTNEIICFITPPKYKGLYTILYIYDKLQPCGLYKHKYGVLNGKYDGISEIYSVLNKVCDARYELFLLDSSGTVIYFTGLINMPVRLDFKLWYNTGIDYSWNNLPNADIISKPVLPNRGTVLAPGKYCFTLCDNNNNNRCQSKALFIGQEIDTINTGCDFRSVTTGYDFECQIKIYNGQNWPITVKIYHSIDIPDLCYEGNYFLNGTYILNPNETKYVTAGINYNKIELMTFDCTEVRCLYKCNN